MTPAFSNLAARLSSGRGVLVDSNVLLDIATDDVTWAHWSARALAECANLANRVINPVIYSEVSIGFATIEGLNAALPPESCIRQPLPWEAGFLAGKCFLACRRRGGLRTTPLPDFYIGAHAAIGHLALLARDVSRYRTCFPTVELLGPR